MFSYAHADTELRDQLETHLKLLQRHGTISTWHDRKIVGGETWADASFSRLQALPANGKPVTSLCQSR